MTFYIYKTLQETLLTTIFCPHAAPTSVHSWRIICKAIFWLKMMIWVPNDVTSHSQWVQFKIQDAIQNTSMIKTAKKACATAYKRLELHFAPQIKKKAITLEVP